MKLTENTKVRIRVPKHLYESIQEELGKMEGSEMEMEEAEEVNEYVGMSPDQAQIVNVLGSLIAAGGLAAGIKTALQVALDKIKSNKSDAAEAPVAEPMAEELQEVLDFETLMEAVKDASKKKVEDKKKKEAEDKKKKEAEAKKKATVKKKAVNEIFGFGKSKNQFKPEQKVIYTASNGSTEYNGEYIVGKVYPNGEIGLYSPDSPMKKISINAKPENLKLA